MGLLSEQRAQSVQIGAVLIFGIIIIFFSTYQAFVVPDQNRTIEFNHNQQAQQQMTELRSHLVLMPGSSSTRSASVDLGTRYPSRAIFVNPGPASGVLRTAQTRDPLYNLSITNAVAAGNQNETDDFWNGTTITYNTGRIEYLPEYNLYQFAPDTIYEHSVLYNRFTRENVFQPLTEQALIDDTKITLVALNGSMNDGQIGTTSVDFEPVSTRTRVIEVNSTGGPIRITAATGLNETQWRSLLEPELVANGGHIKSVSVNDAGSYSLLEITLEQNQRYQIELAKVGVGTGVTETSDAYLTDIEGDGATLEEGSSKTLVVEVRDKFNGPKSNVEIEAATKRSDSSLADTSIRSSTSGKATIEYQAPANIDGTSTVTDQINVSIDVDPSTVSPFDGSDPKNITLNVTVENTDGSGLGNSGGGGPYAITFDLNEIGNEPGMTCGAKTCEYDFAKDTDTTFNLSTFTAPTVTGASVDFSVNTTANGTFTSGSDPKTRPNGRAVGVFDANGTNGITAYVTSGGSGDTLTIDLKNSADNVLFSAISPDPDELSDTDGEFVRVYFPTSTNTDGWTITDTVDGDQQTLPAQTLQGDIYFATDPDKFATYWSIDPARVYNLKSGILDNGGAALVLNDSSDTTLDQVGYEGETTTNGWSLDLNSGDVGYRKSVTEYIDTDRKRNWKIESETSFFSGGNGGFQTGNASSILPTANGQGQSFTFRLDSDMPAGAQLDIILDDPQQNSPLQVDYSSVSVSANRSTDTAQRTTGSDTATLTVSFSSDLSAGTAVKVTATGVKAGKSSNQNNPYDVVFQRSDVYSNQTDTFRVARDSGNAKLQSVSATDLTAGTDNQKQTVTFTLDGDLDSGETVTIDSSDAQDSSGNTQVDYTSASFSVVSGSGTIVNPSATSQEAYLQYQAGGSDTDGDTIKIEVTGVDVGPDSAQSDPYTVGFSRSDAGTTSTTFSVNPPPPPSVESAVLTNAPINESDTTTSQTVTVVFNRSMDTGVDPTVELTGLASSPYSGTNGQWINSTAWEEQFTLNDDDEETTGTISVEGAKGSSGQLQSPNPDTSNTFSVDTDAPTISNFSATTPRVGTLNVTFNASEQLSTVTVSVDDSGGNTVTTLTESDFTETANGDGTYNYTASYSVSSDDTYTATLDSATDTAGNPTPDSPSDTVSVTAACGPGASGVVDDFEDGDIDEYTASGGDKNQFSTTTSPTSTGSSTYALDSENPGGGGGSEKQMQSNCLEHAPREGDTFSYDINYDAVSGGSAVEGFRIEFGNTSNNDHYGVSIVRTSTSNSGKQYALKLENGAGSSQSSSFTMNKDQWYEVELEWQSGTITATVNDTNGQQQAQTSISTNGDEGTYFAYANLGGSVYVDEILRETT